MRPISILILLILLSSCGGDSGDSSSSEQQEQDVSLEVLTDRSDVIWGFDFLSGNRIIFTERRGRIFILNPETQEVTEVANVSQVVAGGEGGLMDLELHPEFSANNQVYFCFTEARGSGRGITLGRGILRESELTDITPLFRSNASNNSGIHFGCRIEFLSNQSLLLSIGDQNNASEAQDPTSHLGKVLRMNDDGTAVQIFTLGNRNVQGIVRRPQTGEIFASEHGPRGGDELNILRSGGNFGWPLVTRGEPQGPLGDSEEGFIDPVISWSPAIAPSGITFYSGDRIARWSGNLFIATLRGQHIRRLTLEGNSVVSEELLFESENLRFRNVQEGPDGFLYFSTDDGKLGRIIE